MNSRGFVFEFCLFIIICSVPLHGPRVRSDTQWKPRRRATRHRKGTGPMLLDRALPLLAVWQEGVPTQSLQAEPTQDLLPLHRGGSAPPGCVHPSKGRSKVSLRLFGKGPARPAHTHTDTHTHTHTHTYGGRRSLALQSEMCPADCLKPTHEEAAIVMGLVEL